MKKGDDYVEFAPVWSQRKKRSVSGLDHEPRGHARF